MCPKFHVHEIFDLKRIHIAGDHEAQVVTDELHDVMIVGNQRMLGEYRALGGFVDFPFQSHHALAAGQIEQFVHQSEQRQVMRLGVLGSFEQLWDSSPGLLDDAYRVGNDECAERSSANDQQFGRLPDRQQLAAMDHESTQHAAEQHDESDNQVHPETLALGRGRHEQSWFLSAAIPVD